MSILFRYILWHYLKIFMMCFIGLTTVYLVVEFFERLRGFIRYDAELSSMLLYLFFKIPDISFKMAPLAGLMATLLAIGILAKNHEITAMRSCGVSLRQITIPFFMVAGVVSIILFIFTAIVIPLSNTRAIYIKNVVIKKKPQPMTLTADHLWLRIRDETIMHITRVKPDGTKLHRVRLFGMNDDFTLREMIQAASATYSETGWVLNSAMTRTLHPQGRMTVETHDSLPLELSLIPEDFQTWISFDPEDMTLQALHAHITHLSEEGHNISLFLTDYWGRIAFSFVTLIMTIFGVSLGLARIGTRHTHIARGIGQAIGIGFLFWATHSVGIALGRSGALAPIMAGWIACVMFIAVGLNLLLKVRY